MNQPIERLLEKLGALERAVTADKGAFRLFALFLREDSPNRWDLLVSAPWLEANQADGMDYLAKQVQSRLDTEELLTISRLVFIGEHTPGLREILGVVNVLHGRVEVGSGNYFGLDIKRGYILTADDKQVADWPTSQSLTRAF
jgi:hypothetical protein